MVKKGAGRGGDWGSDTISGVGMGCVFVEESYRENDRGTAPTILWISLDDLLLNFRDHLHLSLLISWVSLINSWVTIDKTTLLVAATCYQFWPGRCVV